jgi:hypothetical protein
MKNNKNSIKLVHLFLVLFGLSLMGAGCKKGDVYKEIPVEYKKCPCDRNTKFIKTVTLQNALLFDAKKTSFSKMKDLSFDGEGSLFISYSTDTTVLYSIHGDMVGIGYLCNFPEEAKEWGISPNGLHIVFSYDEFELCDPKVSVTINTYANLVLTALKKRE